jgi:sugar (pentulose or hexulose) kinase
MSSKPVFLGIDVGTSGVRGSCIDLDHGLRASHRISLEPPIRSGKSVTQNPEIWQQAVHEVISTLSLRVKPREIAAISIDGTSSTVLLCDHSGAPLAPAMMYNDQSSKNEADEIAAEIPADSAAHGASASLAKTIHLLKTCPDARYICHQADWLASSLTGRYGISDANNCLKLGYDVINDHWPDWMTELNIPADLLPTVLPPGTVIGPILKDKAHMLAISPHCQIVSGTTDSVAAFIATGAKEIGDAVTSLGSTLVLKIVSDKPVYAAEYGIYSHKLGQHWLAGGASNSGGQVLLQHFSQQQLDAMTPKLEPERTTGLNYYPLPSIGERFPRCDPDLKPQLSPRPGDDLLFFQGLLEGIADIEAEGYQQLVNQGAPMARQVFTTGGGSQNPAWNKIRQQKLNIPVLTAEHNEASYGAALLAKQGYINSQ